MAKITVGIPAFRTRFLVQAISSVLTQTFTDFELLLSDDTPDGSASEIVRRFQDPRIRLIEGPRRGLVANSAHVWDHASTDLLKYLHDDDLLFPDALAELSALLAKNPKFTFAAARRAIIDEYGRELRRPMTYLTDDWLWYEPAQLANYLVRTASNPLGEASNLLIRRSAFEGSSCLSQFAGLPITRLVDVAFLFNAARRGPCVATGKYLSARREHPDQISARTKAPDFSLSLLEWEVCLRGAVELGMAPPHVAHDGVARIAALYQRHGADLPEVHHFFGQLAALKESLAAGERHVQTPQFKTDLQRAYTTINLRAANTGDEQPSVRQAQPDAAERPQRIRAHVDRVFRRGMRGWAWIPETPEQRLHVEALVGDRVVGHAVANVHRPELSAWNVGATDYGFELNFYEPLLGDEPPRLRFLADEEWFAGEFRLPPVEGNIVREQADGLLREHARYTAPGEHFEEFAWPQPGERPRRQDGKDPLLVAFYLPQFHPIPENDQNWGPGFTEWRQLPRGVPRFPGHYQPRTPRDLGFYDLRNEETIRNQCEIAEAAGVGAFAFYYYWFNRRRVLERPVEIFLESDIATPFFVIWANENWTRGWDGSEDQILLKQDYSPEDEDELLADLARHMRRANYVRLDGRPLFVIYNPDHIPDTAATLARWRRKWSSAHGLEPLIYMAQTFQRDDPRPYGLDGAMEFPPHKIGSRLRPREVLDAYSNAFAGRVMAYDDLVAASLAEPPPAYPLIKTAAPSWDNEARRPNRGVIFEGSTPQKYEAWLTALIERAMDQPAHGMPIVAINAWNEWAEGAYLEPDVHFGAAYLNATARARDAAVRKRNGGA